MLIFFFIFYVFTWHPRRMGLAILQYYIYIMLPFILKCWIRFFHLTYQIQLIGNLLTKNPDLTFSYTTNNLNLHMSHALNMGRPQLFVKLLPLNSKSTSSDSKMYESSNSSHFYCLVWVYPFLLAEVSDYENEWCHLLVHQITMGMNTFVALSWLT